MQAKIQLKKTSLIDYPGCVSSVFFFRGCNLFCPWCHNRELILGGEKGGVSLEAGLAHLHKRKQVLGGLVLSGGEPCLYSELPDLIREIKKIPLPVKLDTNGMFPLMLEKLFSRIETRPDYIALDLKIAPSRYAELLPVTWEQGAGFKPGEALIQSAALLRASGINHEYRSLALPGAYFSGTDLEALAPLTDLSPWHFRPFIGGNCLDPAWDAMEETTGTASERVKTLAKKARDLGKNGIS